MAQKDYYSILGLSEADRQLHGKEFEDKLSKEFRKLSLKWHPDRWVNGTDEEKKEAEEKFKEIAEAYSVLSDEEKRNQYDNQGQDQDFDPFPDGFNPFDFIRQHMGGASFMGGFGGPFGQGDFNQSNPYAPRQGDTLRTNVTITLKEAYEGCTKKVKYSKQGTCDHCHGTGFEDGKAHHCPHCNGTGKITQRGAQGGMVFETTTMCPYCHGTGKNRNEKDAKPCHVCGGSGNKFVTVEHEIPVPRGVDNGTIMGYAGLGNDGVRGGAAGNLEVVFNVQPDPYYQRIGQNLGHYIDVPFTKALMGFETEVDCIDGSKVKLVVPELTKDGQAFVFQGKGMPSLDRFGRNGPEGDMGVIVRYKFPNKLTNKQRELLKKLDAEK